MESNSMRWRGAPESLLRRFDWGTAATWALGFGLIAYLGFEGGGYDPLVHDRAGIAIWWVLLATVAVGALPARHLPKSAWAGLALLMAFAAWTALSLGWTESAERTLADLARVAGYLGVFALAVLGRGRDDGRRLLAAVGTGIAFVALLGLLSRLHPAWFPAADETAQLLSGNEERLSYPLNYWNGLAALIAIGFPLLLQTATTARAIVWRAVSAAALPVLTVTAFLTLSRGGIGAAVIAVVVYLALASDRLPKLLTLLAGGAGGAALCLAVAARDSLHDGLIGSAAEAQGDEVLMLTVLVCLVVAAIQAAFTVALRDGRRPGWTVPSRRGSLAVAGVAALAALATLAVVDAPGRAADAWDEFKQADSPGEGSGRLISASGQNRYAYWESAVDQNATRPLTGTGSGTFELWWTRDRDSTDAVRDTHSLYMQTLGELGIVGLALLFAFLLFVFGIGTRATMRAGPDRRSLLAAALAGCLAFCLTAAVDWIWQIPVLAVALLLLASLLVAPGPPPEDGGRATLPVPLRVAFCLFAAVAIIVIAIPLSSESEIRQSEEDVRQGDLAAALAAARSAVNVEPGAASPRLQEALVLEQIGAFGRAAAAARGATERGETNWRTWLVLARVEAQRGEADAAVSAYRRARSLNPESPLFDR
jgi:O-Antigen ligase